MRYQLNHIQTDVNGISLMIKPVLLFLLFCSNLALAQMQPFVLKQDTSSLNFGLISEFFYDESGQLQLSDLQQNSYREQFIPLYSTFLQFGVKKGNTWIHSQLNVADITSPSFKLRIRAPRVQRVDIYIPQTGNTPVFSLGEHTLSAVEQKYPYSMIDLPTNAGPVIDVYIKMASNTPINAIIELTQTEEVVIGQYRGFVLSGILIGALILLSIAYIIIGILYRHTMYLLYSIVLIDGIMLHLTFHGYFPLILPDFFEIQTRIYNFLVLAASVVILLFSRAFLDTKNNLPEFDFSFLLLTFVMSSLAVIYTLQPDFLSIIYFSLLLIASTLFLTFISVVALIRKVPYANIYFIARTTILAGYLYWSLISYGVSSNMAFFFWGLTITIFLDGLIHLIGAFIRLKSSQSALLNRESSLYNTQAFEIIGDLIGRMKRQLNVTKSSLASLSESRIPEHKEHSGYIEKANLNLEHLLERLENLNDWNKTQEGNRNSYIYVDTLIDEVLNSFHELDQDQMQVTLQALDMPQNEQVNQGELLKQLLLALLLECKHFSNTTLTITLEKRLNSLDSISYLALIIEPLPRHITEHNAERLNLGMGYINTLINRLNGQLITTQQEEKQLHILIPIRYKTVDHRPETDNLHSYQLFILGESSNTRKKLFSLLHTMPINIIQIKDIAELEKHELHKSPEQLINIILLLDYSGYIPQLMIRQIKPLLRVEDQCLLISDNFKMPKSFATSIGFDDLIHSLELEQQLKATIARLTEKGLRLQKARLL